MDLFGGKSSFDEPTAIHYRLGRSMVRVTGTATCVEDLVVRSSTPSSTATVTVVAESDPETELRLRTTHDWFKNRDFELKFADDGRLSSVSSTEVGVGGTIVEAGVRMATVAVALGARFAGVPLLLEPSREAIAKATQDWETFQDRERQAPNPYDVAYELADAESAKRRAEVKQTLSRLVAALARVAEEVAASTTLHEQDDAAGRFQNIEKTLDATRAEAAKLEAVFDAWRATMITTTTEDLGFSLDTDQLLSADDADELTLVTDDLPERLKVIARKLNVVVARTSDPDRPSPGRAWNADEPLDGIYIRLPRPLVLSVYETTDPPGHQSRSYRRTSREVVWVVDEHSQLDFIGFNSPIFGKHAAGVELSTVGAVTKISSSATAPAGELARAITASIGQVQGTLDDVGKMSDSLGKLRAAGEEERLAALKRQKEELETSIANKGLLANRADQEKLASVKAETDLLLAQKQLAAAQAPPAPPAPPDELATLRAQLEKAIVELQLRQVQAALGAATASESQ